MSDMSGTLTSGGSVAVAGRASTYHADRASVQGHDGQSSRPWQLIVALAHAGQASAPGVDARFDPGAVADAADVGGGSSGATPSAPAMGGSVVRRSVVGIHSNCPHSH